LVEEAVIVLEVIGSAKFLISGVVNAIPVEE
jgi:hypothetical protein